MLGNLIVNLDVQMWNYTGIRRFYFFLSGYHADNERFTSTNKSSDFTSLPENISLIALVNILPPLTHFAFRELCIGAFFTLHYRYRQ